MVKSREEVIAQFNEQVNMTVEELEEWLENPQSKEAGTGVGVESGHMIVEILRKNPARDPEKYDEDDLEHMRKVVSYANRHLAQENHLKETKTREELENTKSTISLKNWGHDPVKTVEEEANRAGGNDEVTQSDVQESGVESSTNGHDKSSTPEVDEEEASAGEQTEKTTEEKEVKKRKLGTGKEEEPADVSKSVDDSDAVESGEDAGEDEDEARSDEPPRKKTKNDVA